MLKRWMMWKHYCRGIVRVWFKLRLHNLAGFGDIAQLFGEIQQPSFVFNDGIGTMEHESYLGGFG